MKKLFRRYGLFVAGVIIGSVLAATITAIAVGEIISAQYNHELKVIYNGNELDLDVPMIAVVDSDDPRSAVNYMPIRAVLEAMGYDVDYDPVNRAALINTQENGGGTENQEIDSVAITYDGIMRQDITLRVGEIVPLGIRIEPVGAECGGEIDWTYDRVVGEEIVIIEVDTDSNGLRFIVTGISPGISTLQVSVGGVGAYCILRVVE